MSSPASCNHIVHYNFNTSLPSHIYIRPCAIRLPPIVNRRTIILFHFDTFFSHDYLQWPHFQICHRLPFLSISFCRLPISPNPYLTTLCHQVMCIYTILEESQHEIADLPDRYRRGELLLRNTYSSWAILFHWRTYLLKHLLNPKFSYSFGILFSHPMVFGGNGSSASRGDVEGLQLNRRLLSRRMAMADWMGFIWWQIHFPFGPTLSWFFGYFVFISLLS